MIFYDSKPSDFEDVLDRDLGKVGTPKRDEFERKVDEAICVYQAQNGCKNGCKS